MIVPPAVVDVRVLGDGHRMHLWLPIVLLWPLLFILVALVMVVTIPLDVVATIVGARYHKFTLLVLGLLEVLSEARGCRIHINSSDGQLVEVDIY